MPGFQAHIIGSSILGAGYGVAGWYLGGMPPATAALGAGLCAASGMLPDLDNGDGMSLRESTAFAAALMPLLMIQRFQQWGLPLEGMILAAATIYAVVRFGLAYLIENFSTHRGMLHSVPAAVIAGQVTFLAFVSAEPLHRYFIAGAVVLGFLSHLVLDEIWAVR
ncbi:MAG: metal-dependent hydrolase, partial [Planctomycetota bacterium]